MNFSCRKGGLQGDFKTIVFSFAVCQLRCEAWGITSLLKCKLDCHMKSFFYLVCITLQNCLWKPRPSKQNILKWPLLYHIATCCRTSVSLCEYINLWPDVTNWSLQWISTWCLQADGAWLWCSAFSKSWFETFKTAIQYTCFST